MFSENSELITKKQDVASNFNYYFGSVVENLRLFQWNEHNGEIHSKNVETIVKNFKTIPVVELSKNISKTTSLSLLGMQLRMKSKMSFLILKIIRQLLVKYRSKFLKIAVAYLIL